MKKKEILNKAVNVILNVSIVLVGITLLITIYNFVQIKILDNTHSSFFGYSLFEVKTGSMEKELSIGDWIVVKNTGKYDLDDVVTFVEEGKFVTHRIVEIVEDGYVTKGDANNKKDGVVEEKTIVGELKFTIPAFGILKNTLFNPIVLILIMITFYILTLVFDDKFKNGKYKEMFKKKQKEDDLLDNFGEDIVGEHSFEIKNNNEVSIAEVDSAIEDEIIENKSVIESEEVVEEKIMVEENNVDGHIIVDGNVDTTVEDEIEKEIDLPLTKPEFTTKKETISFDDDDTSVLRIITVDDDITKLREQLKPALEEEEVEVKEEVVEEFTNPLEELTDEKVDFETVEEEEKSEEATDEESSLAEEELKDTDFTEDKANVFDSEEEELDPKDEKFEEQLELDMILGKTENKTCNGVLDKLLAIKYEEINKIIGLLFNYTGFKNNEPTIKKELISSYVNSKYYNLYSKDLAVIDKSSTAKYKYVTDLSSKIINQKNGYTKKEITEANTILKRISYSIEEDCIRLYKTYKGTDKEYAYKLEKFANLVMLYARLEYLVESSRSLKNQLNLYISEVMKYSTDYNLDITINDVEDMCRQVIKIQRNHRKLTKYLMTRFNTEVFDLTYTPFKGSNKYVVNLLHNVNFNKIYSEEAINKVYEEGIVAEDKIKVLMTLLQIRLGKDMFKAEFDNEYFVTIPNSLCGKERKFEKLLATNDNMFTKESVIYLISYDSFVQHMKVIKKLVLNNYRFSCYIDEKTNFVKKSKEVFTISEYVFIDNSIKTFPMDKVLVSNFKNKIIKENLHKKMRMLGDE